MRNNFNRFNEHILVPFTLVWITVLSIGLVYLGYEYAVVHADSEVRDFYGFENEETRNAYLYSTGTNMIGSSMLLVMCLLSMKWKKRWLLLTLNGAGMFQIWHWISG